MSVSGMSEVEGVVWPGRSGTDIDCVGRRARRWMMMMNVLEATGARWMSCSSNLEDSAVNE